MTEKQSPVEQDQPEKESQVDDQDQVLESDEEAGADDQPEKESDEEGQGIEIDGQTLTLEELKQGYMRERDYRKKTQELADLKREVARLSETKNKATDDEKIDPQVKQALEVLKKHKMATTDDIDERFKTLQAQQEDERQFQGVYSKNPELKGHEEFIRAYGYQNPTLSWEDIFAKYKTTLGIGAKKKLEKAKQSKPIVGSRAPQKSGNKSVSDMTPKEYEAWKQENVGNNSFQ